MAEKMSAMALACLGKREEIQIAPIIDLQGLQETYKAIAEEQKQTGGVVQYRIKIPSGGGKAFDILTGDEETDTSVTTFAGVIVHHHKCNALFDEDSEGNTPPVCSSIDGVHGVTADGEQRACAGCPFNAFGTAKKGKGKACKNMHKLYIMSAGVPIPFVLCLPPTSLKNVQNYLLNTLAVRRLKPYQVMTEFSTVGAQNAAGTKYSIVKFKLLGMLDEQDRQAAEFFATGMQFAADVSAEDYNREPRQPDISVEPDPTDFDDIDPFDEVDA